MGSEYSTSPSDWVVYSWITKKTTCVSAMVKSWCVVHGLPAIIRDSFERVYYGIFKSPWMRISKVYHYPSLQEGTCVLKMFPFIEKHRSENLSCVLKVKWQDIWNFILSSPTDTHRFLEASPAIALRSWCYKMLQADDDYNVGHKSCTNIGLLWDYCASSLMRLVGPQFPGSWVSHGAADSPFWS